MFPASQANSLPQSYWEARLCVPVYVPGDVNVCLFMCVLSCKCGGHTCDIRSIVSFLCDALDGRLPRSRLLSFSVLLPS